MPLPTPRRRDGPRAALRVGLSLVIALGVSGGLGLAWWSRAATTLSGHINIIGHPTFADFAFSRSFLTYRLIIWEFPLVSALVFAALQWRGPLSAPRPSARMRVELIEPAVVDANATLSGPTRWVQLLPAAVVLAGAVSTRSMVLGAKFAEGGLAAAVAYVAAVTGLAVFALPWLARRGLLAQRFVADGAALPVVNAFASILVSVGALLFVSRRTLVIAADNQSANWPWFPVWLAAVVLVGVLVWTVWRLRGWTADRVERRIRTVMVGSVAIFLLTATIPGDIFRISGFDDAQSPVGADLLTRGYFPWRDFMFIHGLFEDALRTSIGFGVFQHTLWGGLAGTALIVVPMCWVGYYLLSVWAGLSRTIVVLAVFALAAWGQLPASARFVAVPFVFVLLGEALRRPKPIWVAGLTAALFLEAVLVPEASFQVVAVTVTIVAADLVHRDPQRTWWAALRRTRWFLGTSVLLGVVFAGYLELNHALRQFVDYFRIFGPGHDASGAIPRTGVTTIAYSMFVFSAALVALTIWMATWRLIGRRSWSARDWVTVSAALLIGLYGEKALGRFDNPHVLQVAAVGVPLWILWATTLFGVADDFVAAQLSRLRAVGRFRIVVRQPVALLAAVLLTVLVPGVARGIWRAPGQTKIAVASLAQAPLIGYERPGAVDPQLLSDLRTVLNTYAGADGKIFDNTNSLGYFYYLLQRAPASRFVHVSMAEPEFAQHLLIAQLATSRPALVAFDEQRIGLPAWDGPRNNVRHFEVAQYLLDGWTPVLSTHSVVFLLRNDLIATMLSVPSLTTAPQTKDLHFAVPACDWGDSADFLASRAAGPTVSLPVTRRGAATRLEVRGWSYDPSAHGPPGRIVITIGGKVVADVPLSVNRPDVANYLKTDTAMMSGYDALITTSGRETPRAYALEADGALHPVGIPPSPSPPYIQMPSGVRLPVSFRAVGSLDRTDRREVRLSTITVPESVDLASYRLATFSAETRIGTARLELTDAELTANAASGAVAVTADGTHEITAGVLPVTGTSLPVRVGSCLQWHGYTSRTLALIQTGGAPITSVVLSGVRD